MVDLQKPTEKQRRVLERADLKTVAPDSMLFEGPLVPNLVLVERRLVLNLMLVEGSLVLQLES